VYHANYWAKGVMDSGSYTDVAIFTTAGLTGKNVVIGVSDTGLDLNSNYFYDTVSITANSPTASPHRKVASYAYVSGKGDFTDISQGHGSHGIFLVTSPFVLIYFVL
jgi:subtilisin family serine protease